MDQSGDIYVVAEGHSTQRTEVGVFVNCGESEVYKKKSVIVVAYLWYWCVLFSISAKRAFVSFTAVKSA